MKLFSEESIKPDCFVTAAINEKSYRYLYFCHQENPRLQYKLIEKKTKTL